MTISKCVKDHFALECILISLCFITVLRVIQIISRDHSVKEKNYCKEMTTRICPNKPH